MTEILRLDDYLNSLTDKFEKRKKLLILSSLFYRKSSEKVITGFRYFDCPIDPLKEAFERQDFAAIMALPFAVDEDGDVDTSAVLLDLAYTYSGAFVAAQPVEYQDYNPTPVASPLLIEGEPAKQLFALIKELDQTE